METIESGINGLIILKPTLFQDKRGYFMESFQDQFFKENFSNFNFIQENECSSCFGVLRGLHFQKPPYSQAKVIRVIEGEVLDVAVDLRQNSKTYGKSKSVLLSGENKKQFFIPRDFAHGFITLSKKATMIYKVDNYYSPSHESGIIYNDSDLNIDWVLNKNEIILSEKDSKLKSLSDLK